MRWQERLEEDLLRINRLVLRGSIEGREELSRLELMVLSLEDRRLFRHFGVDPWSVARELTKLSMGRKYGGASTIDMQFVRTATGYRALTLKRKLYESLLAVLIQFRYDKVSILESYLGCAHFGYGLTGAETTAQKLFGKTANQLDLVEAALISAMLARPRPAVASRAWQLRIEKRAAYAIEVYLSGKVRLPRQMRPTLVVPVPLQPGEQRKLEFPEIV
jgi:membrane carboxypeptidase/penicillin-binding protein PbpC